MSGSVTDQDSPVLATGDWDDERLFEWASRIEHPSRTETSSPYSRILPIPETVNIVNQASGNSDDDGLAISRLHSETLAVVTRNAGGLISNAVINDAVARWRHRVKQFTDTPEHLADAAYHPPSAIHITCRRCESYEEPVPKASGTLDDDHAREDLFVPHLGDAESYELVVDSVSGVKITADGITGVLYALETLYTIVYEHAIEGKVTLSTVGIRDAPRLGWRGLMVDTSRHFIRAETLYRTVDAMAHNKLNVLHLHLSDDHGFRFESKVYPKLHTVGASGPSRGYYSQSELRNLIRYAAWRGIRVVPEIDVPGHAAALLAAYPELGCRGGDSNREEYKVLDVWGINLPNLDPTSDKVYEFLREMFAEISSVFPDQYLHVGGDEVDPEEWRSNHDIRAYMQQNGIHSYPELQLQFNLRLLDEVVSHPSVNRTMIGWDEILTPKLHRASTKPVIQSWQGHHALVRSSRTGFSSVLSAGYYLDHMHPASEHYKTDPHHGIRDEDKSSVLGGEACMWCEYADDHGFDAKVWPRMSAIAERLWSSVAKTRNVREMYARLDAMSDRLQAIGITHLSSPLQTLAQIFHATPAPDSPTPAVNASLLVLAHALKPRNRVQTPSYTQGTPLNGLVDALPPESVTCRRLRDWIEDLIAAVKSGDDRPERLDDIVRLFAAWHAQYDANLALLRDHAPAHVETSLRVSQLGVIGLTYLQQLVPSHDQFYSLDQASSVTFPSEPRDSDLAEQIAREPIDHVLLAGVDAVSSLYTALPSTS